MISEEFYQMLVAQNFITEGGLITLKKPLKKHLEHKSLGNY